MPLLNFDLATKGMDQATKLKIIKRHFFSFIRHITVKKLLNFLLTEYNMLQKKSYVSSYPYILKIESTNICNLKCVYCYDNRRMPDMGERPYGRMPFDNFKKLIDELSPYLFKINLYGFGEPFLFSETIDMVKYASKKNIGVGISSNMNFEDSYLPRKIVKSGLEVLIFSCHGVTQETYSKFMVKGDMELAMRNIKKVIEERGKIGSKTPLIDWQFCVTQFNEKELDIAKEKAKEIGIDQIRFIKPFFPEDAENEWFSSLFPKNIPETLGEKKAGCSWVYRSAYINYDGGLLPCCKDFRLLANDFGNVFKEGFASIWNNDNYSSSRKLIANPEDRNIKCNTICAHCPITIRL
jgi:MoaA/NifB/PqqE/SkfB family radical SAM enzyme